MIDRLPTKSGAYVIFFNLRGSARLDIARLGFPFAAPGHYAYCGSARGPGGLRARIARHLRPGKPLHWHIDRLTAVGRVTDVALLLGGSECDLMDRLLANDRVSIPIRGFGSTDCSRCSSHLARLDLTPEAALHPSGVPSNRRIEIVSVPN